MSHNIYSVITGTGKYIPTKVVKNEDFLDREFYDGNGLKIDKSNQEIIEKFQAITTIAERRYAADDQVASDLGYLAAEDALTSSGIDRETLDYIIVAHNFGDISINSRELDIVPSLAARVKFKLGIENPNTVAYDLPFGCPGWLQGMIQADYYIKSGDAKKVMVIGAEVLSRVCDPHDRDSMIYADGAGATILEGKHSESPIGILAHASRSDTILYSKMLYMGESFKSNGSPKSQFLKMNGRKLYQYALETVPKSIKACLEKADVDIRKVKKILIHQANGKMDEEIMKRLYGLYPEVVMPVDVMPMTISWLGNSSVATVPTLLDFILKGELNGHRIDEGDVIVFASVGAGMNINAAVYQY
jgi:3-oxoacyl-[acyl-carrier-protein] synthase III